MANRAAANRRRNSALLAGYGAGAPVPGPHAGPIATNHAHNSALLAGYGAGAGRPNGLPPQRPSNPAPGVGTPPGQPQAPAASAAFAPDAEYLAAAAQRQFDRTQAITALTTTSANDKTDTTEAIRRLLQGAPEQRQGIKQNANKAGLFYSGQLGKQLNEYESNLTRSQSDTQLDYDRREQARAAARAAIEQGAPLEEAAALAEAATRQVGRDTDAANANALVPTPLPAGAPTAAPVVRSSKPQKTTQAKRYRWPDGKLHSRPYRGR